MGFFWIKSYQASELILDFWIFSWNFGYIYIYFFFFLIWTTILDNSGLKLLLYGPRIWINYSPPGNIGNWGLQHSPESWKYWKSEFFNFLISWKYWKTDFFNFLISWKYWIVRSILSPILEILDRTIHTQSYPGNSGSYDPYSVLSWK